MGRFVNLSACFPADGKNMMKPFSGLLQIAALNRRIFPLQ